MLLFYKTINKWLNNEKFLSQMNYNHLLTKYNQEHYLEIKILIFLVHPHL